MITIFAEITDIHIGFSKRVSVQWFICVYVIKMADRVHEHQCKDAVQVLDVLKEHVGVGSMEPTAILKNTPDPRYLPVKGISSGMQCRPVGRIPEDKESQPG